MDPLAKPWPQTVRKGLQLTKVSLTVAVGRYGLTILGERDPTDAAEYSAHKIGTGTNQVLGFPREGEVGYTAATGISINAGSSDGGRGTR